MRPTPASLRRRAGARLIDLLVLLLGFAAVIAGAIGFLTRGATGAGEEASRPRMPDLSAGQQLAIRLAGAAVVVRMRNRRSLGMRLMGLRRVDGWETGSPSERGSPPGFSSACLPTHCRRAAPCSSGRAGS